IVCSPGCDGPSRMRPERSPLRFLASAYEETLAWEPRLLWLIECERPGKICRWRQLRRCAASGLRARQKKSSNLIKCLDIHPRWHGARIVDPGPALWE